MVIERSGQGDDLINGHVIRRKSDQTTGAPDWSNITGCTFADAYETASDDDNATFVDVGADRDGSISRVMRNPLRPADEPDAFVQSSDPVTPWTKTTRAAVGAQYSYAGKKWICRQSHDSQAGWHPGAAGVDALWTKLPSSSTKWDYPVSYTIGDERTYNAVLYRCIQSHTSQASWTPSAVPALWAMTEKFTKARGANGLA